MRTTMIIVATAALATGAAIFESSGISPSEMHLRLNPAELPQQQVDNYN
jgi:hypothetical protein